MMMMPERELLTVEEAAQLLGIGRTSAYSLVMRGELQSMTIGRSRRVPRKIVLSYIERKLASASVPCLR